MFLSATLLINIVGLSYYLDTVALFTFPYASSQYFSSLFFLFSYQQEVNRQTWTTKTAENWLAP